MPDCRGVTLHNVALSVFGKRPSRELKIPAHWDSRFRACATLGDVERRVRKRHRSKTRTSMSSISAGVSFIKIDVEGGDESDVLAGARETILREKADHGAYED